MENHETIGAKIVSLRKTKGITQADLGAFLNVSYQAVSKWERDESCPDFVTLSRMAQFFNVPISYFEENGNETAAAVDASAPVHIENEKMLGVCKDCGKVIYEGNEGLTAPVLVCKECVARRKLVATAKEVAAKREREKQEQELRMKKAMEQERIAKCRGRGLICGSILAGICVLLGIFELINTKDVASLLGGILIGVFAFTWSSQMFWDGFVFDATTFGGKHIGTPGVIFDLSLDGVIFLIVVKLLFALLRFAVYIISLLACVVFAVLVSPFTFVPALLRVNRGDFM